MTDDTISIPDATEWVDEPPDELKLYLDRDRLKNDEYQATARTVTRAVLDSNPREAAVVDTLGLTDMLREYVDAEAVDVLARESELTVDEMEFYGHTDATQDVLDALLALYSDPLIELTVYGADGTAIVARRDGTMLWCWLPESASPQLEQRLDGTKLAALEEI